MNKHHFQVKPSESPPVTRYVLRDPEGFYYTGHGQAPRSIAGQDFEAIGEFGIPGFGTKNILFAIKYGDLESIDRLFKDFKIWCIEHDRADKMDLLDKCEVVETYT